MTVKELRRFMANDSFTMFNSVCIWKLPECRVQLKIIMQTPKSACLLNSIVLQPLCAISICANRIQRLVDVLRKCMCQCTAQACELYADTELPSPHQGQGSGGRWTARRPSGCAPPRRRALRCTPLCGWRARSRRRRGAPRRRRRGPAATTCRPSPSRRPPLMSCCWAPSSRTPSLPPPTVRYGPEHPACRRQQSGMAQNTPPAAANSQVWLRTLNGVERLGPHGKALNDTVCSS